MNLSRRHIEGERKATLYRVVLDNASGRIRVELFTMDFELFSNGIDVNQRSPDLRDYIVLETNTRHMWRYRVGKETHNIVNDFFGDQIDEVVVGRSVKQELISQLHQLSPGMRESKEFLLTDAMKYLDILPDKLQSLEEGRTTVLFCTHYEQVRRLVFEMQALQTELEIPIPDLDNTADFVGVDINQELRKQNDRFKAKRFASLPLLCQLFQQGEAIRL